MTTGKIIVEVDRDLEDLMPLFWSSREQDLQGLAKGIEESDFNTLRSIGHDMKGTGSSFGFHRVSEIGDLIEVAALANDLLTIQGQFGTFKDYMSRIEISFVDVS